MKLSKAINALEQSKSPTYQRIKAVAVRSSRTINKDVSLGDHLPALCTFFDKINQRDLSDWELREFNELIGRYFGSMLQQEMDDNEIRWK